VLRNAGGKVSFSGGGDRPETSPLGETGGGWKRERLTLKGVCFGEKKETLPKKIIDKDASKGTY